MVKFTVIIPVYNVAPYLRDCLKSVILQSFESWEIIVVDDGSTDGSAEILDQCATADSRIVVVHQANLGVAAARNAALDKVQGDWVLFLDGDDVYAPNAFSRLSQVINCYDCDVVFFGTYRFKDCDDVSWPQSSRSVTIESVNEIVPIMRSSSFGGGQAYRWSAIKDIRQEPFHYGEDMLFLTQVLVRSSRIAFMSDCLYGYRMRATSAMHRGYSVRYFDDLIRTRFLALREIAHCKKKLDGYSAKWIGGELTEEASMVLRKLGGVERSDVLSKYRNICAEVSILDVGLNSFDRMRLWVVSRIPLLRGLVCDLPRFFRSLYGRLRRSL